MNNVIDFINVNRERYLDELKALLAIPSISALPEHAADVRRCAEWCADEMRRIGLQNVAADRDAGQSGRLRRLARRCPASPTILFYGHYDVQPVDPLNLWESPPFEATIRDGEIYARGSADDKGQVFMHMKAIEAHLKQNGRLPVNIKFILEGEEEVGSENLDDFIQAHNAELAADVVVISDSAMFARGVPSICYGLRGLVYFQIDLRGSRTDLHSGSFGGAVANPAFVLAQMIAQMKDRERPHQDSRLLRRCAAAAGGGAPGVGVAAVQRKEVPEGLRHPEAARRDRLHDARADLGAADARSERAALRIHRRGRQDGAAGRGDGEDQHAAGAQPGSRTRSPRLFEAFIAKAAPKTVEVKVTRMHGGKPWMTSFDNPFVQAAGRAIEKGFGRAPIFTREGGSIPVVSTFQEELGLPSVLFGVGLPDENAHAPNEKLDLGNFHNGVIASAVLYDELGKLPG